MDNEILDETLNTDDYTEESEEIGTDDNLDRKSETGTGPECETPSGSEDNLQEQLQAQQQKTESSIDLQKLESESYQKGKIEGLVGIKNHYTGQEIKDSFDAEEYIQMLEAEKAGYDPNTELNRYQKDIARKAHEEQQKTATQTIDIASDSMDFQKAYPNVNIDSLLSNERFMMFADGKLGNKPLASIYASFEKFTAGSTNEVKQKAQSLLAKKLASPGTANANDGEQPGAYYSLEQIKKMTNEEVAENYDKVTKSLKKLGLGY